MAARQSSGSPCQVDLVWRQPVRQRRCWQVLHHRGGRHRRTSAAKLVDGALARWPIELCTCSLTRSHYGRCPRARAHGSERLWWPVVPRPAKGAPDFLDHGVQPSPFRHRAPSPHFRQQGPSAGPIQKCSHRHGTTAVLLARPMTMTLIETRSGDLPTGLAAVVSSRPPPPMSP